MAGTTFYATQDQTIQSCPFAVVSHGPDGHNVECWHDDFETAEACALSRSELWVNEYPQTCTGDRAQPHADVVAENGPCAACEAGEPSVHAYEPPCECFEDYGPCELHCEVLAQREGASMRTADELAYVFVRDAQDCGVVLHRDDVTFLAEVAAALDGPTDRGSWIEDADLADQLRELADSTEGRLPVGMLAYWDDGYRIVRVTGGPFA